jgi:hypothetical protein
LSHRTRRRSRGSTPRSGRPEPLQSPPSPNHLLSHASAMRPLQAARGFLVARSTSQRTRNPVAASQPVPCTQPHDREAFVNSALNAKYAGAAPRNHSGLGKRIRPRETETCRRPK